MTTFAMIEEFIEGCTVIGPVPRSDKHFTHVVQLHEHDDSFERGLLPCGTPDETAEYLGKHPKDLCLCITQDRIYPRKLEPFKQHVLALYCEEGPAETFNRVQRLLLRLVAWENDMKTALLEGKSYQALLTLSERVLGNFISISNSDFRLIAYTKNVAIVDSVVDSLLRNGFHTKETVDLFTRLHTTKDWESQKKITLKPVSDLNTHPVLDYVFRMQGKYFLHINMHCNARKPSVGLTDAFQVLINCLEYCVKQDWNNRFALHQEPSRLFGDLIERKPQSKRVFAERLRTIGIPPEGPFTLLAFRLLGESSSDALLSYCVGHLKDTFPSCFAGSYGSHALLLDPNEATKANGTEQLRLFAESHFCSVGISEPFFAIHDFPYAFQQAIQAIEMSTRSRLSLAAALDGNSGTPLHSFRDCFAYFVADTARNSSHLIEHFGQSGIVKRIADSDAQRGNDDVRILYFYLKNERKASVTCSELFIHRNTLLYRIRKMEENFDFSLDDVNTRRQIMTEFLIYSK